MNNKSFGKTVQIFFILLLFISTLVFGQDKKNDDIKKLKVEIISVYKTGGEQALLDFYQKNRAKITGKFIVYFAKSGKKEKNETALKTSLILAKSKGIKKNMAYVYFKTGEYYRIISDFKKGSYYFDKALIIYKNLNHPAGQGKIYMERGIINYYKGNYDKSLELYEKAMSFFQKAEDIENQGNVYLKKGLVFYFLGNNDESLDMANKALTLFKKTGYQRGKADAYLHKGKIFFFKANFIRATEMYKRAMHFYKQAGEINGQGQVYLEKGDIFSHTGKIQKAMELYNKALHIFIKDKDLRGQGKAFLNIGEIFIHENNFSKANEVYNKALKCFKRVNSILGQGNVYMRKGMLCANSDKKEEALEMYDKAILLFMNHKEPVGLANVYLNKGYVYLLKGDYSKAIEICEKAKKLYEKAKEPRGQAEVYRNLGEIYCHMSEYPKALKMYKKAKSYFFTIGNLRGVGNVYQAEGDIYLYTGHFTKALEKYSQGFPFTMLTGMPIDLGNAYLSKGNLYLFAGYYSRAEEMYNEALPHFEKAGDHLGQGNIYRNKGHIKLYTKKFDKALEMYRKALNLFKTAKIPIGEGASYQAMGYMNFYTGKTSKALEMFNKALILFEKLGDSRNQGIAYLSKGDAYFRDKKLLKAMEMYDIAEAIFSDISDTESQALSLFGKSRCLAWQKRKGRALTLIEGTIDRLEKVRYQTAFSKIKMTYLDKFHEQYEEAVLFMMKNKYFKRGFEYAERMRSRVFLDRMGEGLVPLEKGLKPELRDKRDKLVGKLSNLSKQMQETGGKEEKKMHQLKNDYHKVENEFEELLIKIRLDNPLYASVRYPKPVSLQELRKKVLKKGEILLRYFISPNTAYVFIISKKKFKVKKIKIKADEVKSHVNLYLKAVENKTEDVEFYGKVLYRGLFKPIEKKLKKRHDIIIIPDGLLEKIPFEAFITGENESGKPVYLIEKYRVKYIQSASILSVLRKYYQRDRECYSFVGFGDPVYDYKNFKEGKPEKGTTARSSQEEDGIKDAIRTRYAQSGGILDRLPGSGEEVRSIAKLFEDKEQKAVLYSREQATEEKAKAADLKEFDFIHFACHGLLNDDFQSLVLSQDIPGAKEDGYLTLNEIMNCDYNAKLVVLSACETGAGKLEKGEGVTGLTRAVMYAGTPAVVASLWKVDDKAAKELMTRFYKNMLENNMSKTKALRQAKLGLLKNKKYSSPFYWSAFVLYGE